MCESYPNDTFIKALFPMVCVVSYIVSHPCSVHWYGEQAAASMCLYVWLALFMSGGRLSVLHSYKVFESSNQM